jgi:hypothetical protein
VLGISIGLLFLWGFERASTKPIIKLGDSCCVSYYIGSTGNPMGCREQGHIVWYDGYVCQKDKDKL